MEQDQAQFNALLVNLLSTENEIRSNAETAYDGLPAGSRALFLLGALVNQAAEEQVRVLAAVLLRRLFSTDFDKCFPELPPEAQAQLKDQLLLSIQNETSNTLRKRVCECAAELARKLLDDDANNHWPEFLKFLFTCASASSPVLRESALQIFTSVPGIFGNQQSRYLDMIRQMLVRFAAVRAVSAFLLVHEKETAIQRMFADSLPVMLQILSESIEALEDDNVVKCFVDLAEACPRFFRPHLDTLMQICLRVIGEPSVPETWRHLCLETVVTLSEMAPAMVRKLAGKHIAQLVPQLFQMMVDLSDDPDWAVTDEITEDDADSDPVVGESSLDRLACSLGGKTILPLVVGCVSQMLASEDWRHRHAALMAVSAAGEGCHKQMEALLPQMIDGILKYLQDPHPRVRYAACNALGQMATDFSPGFEKRFHDRVIPGLALLLEDHAHPRVQAHAGAALVNFFEDCPKSVLLPYLDAVVLKIEAVLSSKMKELVEKGTKLMLEQIVVTLAALADRAEEKFVDYYDRFMPCLKYIIQNASTPDLQLLRGKTIECVSLIGLAVGREKFVADASDVMDMLLKTQTGDIEISEDNPQLSYMISAWARICKILGKQFEPYLPYVMGPVLKAASLKPEIALMDSEDMKVVEGDEDWQFVSFGDQQNFGIRTVGLEEKATACQMLVCYARELKDGFASYAEEVVKLMVPMLKFYFHDDILSGYSSGRQRRTGQIFHTYISLRGSGVRVLVVRVLDVVSATERCLDVGVAPVRSAAAESLPYLLECAKTRGDAYVIEMWQYICPELLSAIDGEPEKEVLSDHMSSFAQCVTVLNSKCLSEEQLNSLITVLDKFLKEHFERAEERQLKRKDEDYDELVEEELLEEDDDDVFLLSKVADILRSLFTCYKEALFPYFDRLLPHFARLLGADRPWPDHQWGLCVFDDIIEYGGPVSLFIHLGNLRTFVICNTTYYIAKVGNLGEGKLASKRGADAGGDDRGPRLPRPRAGVCDGERHLGGEQGAALALPGRQRGRVGAPLVLLAACLGGRRGEPARLRAALLPPGSQPRGAAGRRQCQPSEGGDGDGGGLPQGGHRPDLRGRHADGHPPQHAQE
ncbi:Ran-binding protein, putative [Ixodes scapularis]|uniref:Ran-binding protein, putative n=1 Tax=Ixodes scapularis TaxID=6945 RepID=B7PD93_IXOSC|nr:Ran-binding protein, putative [Ixodes scapularis]|eukprot:XP_002410687.1 Ran-binding protein, putative [Ixodes scapularis]